MTAFGADSLLIAVALALVALFLAGALVSRFTDRGALYSGGRQLLLGGAAAALTYAVSPFAPSPSYSAKQRCGQGSFQCALGLLSTTW